MNQIICVCLASLFVFSCQKKSEDTKDTFILSEKGLTAPVIEKRPVPVTMHGDTRIDNYGWLRNLDIMLGKAEPSEELKALLDKEAAYAQAVLKPTASLVETLKNEFLSRREDLNSGAALPYKMGDYEYWKETKADEISFRLLRRKIGTENTELLIDGPAIAGKAAYMSIVVGEVSPQGTFLPYVVDLDGDLQGDLFLKNMKTGAIVEVKQKVVKGMALGLKVAWSLDERFIFYSVPGTLSRDSAVVKTDLSVQPFKEQMVFDELDGDFYLSVKNSASKKFILLESTAAGTSMYRALSAENTELPMIQFSQKRVYHDYSVDHSGNQFIIRSNRGNGEFALWTADEAQPSEEKWKSLVTQIEIPQPNVIKVFSQFIFVAGYANGELNSVIVSTKDGAVFKINKPDAMSAIQEMDNYDSSAENIRYAMWSPIQNKRVYELNMNSHELKELSEVKLSSFNPDDFEVSNLSFPSTDGVSVKAYMIRKKSLRGQTTPVYMDMYGHYGSNEIAWWKYSGNWGYDVWSLLDRGVGIVVPFFRGTGDISVEWTNAGSVKNKLKTLEDTVAVVKGISDQKISTPNQIVVRGYSAGGINAGYIATHAPQSVKAIVARAAFVDVLNTMSDESIPLTTQEFNVWGNPITSSEDYLRIKSYSPYDNVPVQEYPAIYAHNSLHDSQVPYWEALKWIAQLREHQKGSEPIFIEISNEGSHGGGAGLTEIEENAREQAFILNQMGITK